MIFLFIVQLPVSIRFKERELFPLFIFFLENRICDLICIFIKYSCKRIHSLNSFLLGSSNSSAIKTKKITSRINNLHELGISFITIYSFYSNLVAILVDNLYRRYSISILSNVIGLYHIFSKKIHPLRTHLSPTLLSSASAAFR